MLKANSLFGLVVTISGSVILWAGLREPLLTAQVKIMEPDGQFVPAFMERLSSDPVAAFSGILLLIFGITFFIPAKPHQ